jgi:ATP-dependent RNA helicase RhlE
MPKAVASLAREILDEPVRVDVSPKRVTVEEIDQRVVMVGTSDKQRMLEHLLRDDEVSRAIVFTRTKHGANKVARKLGNAGINAEAIHGNKSQNARQRALRNFKSGDAWVLVATDIAARGIDVEAVSHVFNYELPHEPESYVHRIGRTGRAGATGAAWSLVDPSERGRLRAVEKLIRFSPTHVDVDMPHQEPDERARINDAARANDAARVNRPRRRNRRPASSNQRANAAAHPRAGSRRR